MSRFILFIRSRTLLRFLILRTHVCLFVLLRLKKFCLLCLWILPLRHSLYSFLQRLLTELCFTLYPQRFLMFYVFQHFLSSAFQRISPGISSSILILFLAISSIFFLRIQSFQCLHIQLFLNMLILFQNPYGLCL